MAYTPPNYETPTRFTARNDVTGALIKSRAATEEEQSAYAAGWDRIFSNKNKQEEEDK